MVVAGAVIQVDIPAAVATETVVSHDGSLGCVGQYQSRIFCCDRFHCFIVRVPVTVTSPGVERTMVACFLDRIENIVEFQDMTAPGSFADIDSCTWSIVNTVVADGNRLAHGKFHSGNLLFIQAD